MSSYPAPVRSCVCSRRTAPGGHICWKSGMRLGSGMSARRSPGKTPSCCGRNMRYFVPFPAAPIRWRSGRRTGSAVCCGTMSPASRWRSSYAGTALSEALRVTRPGGVIFAAYCMGDAALLAYGFGQGKIRELLDKCDIDPKTFDGFPRPWDLFHLSRVEDIDRLRRGLPAVGLHRFAAEGYARHLGGRLEAMDDETFRLFLRYHFAVCERTGLLEMSNHVVDVFRKN